MHAASMCLLPVATMRCMDRLSRNALFDFSPAIVVPLVCDTEQAAGALRQEIVDLEQEPDADSGECVRWFRQRLTAETRSAIDRLGIPVARPPAPEHPAMVSYCPRCHAQFGVNAGNQCSICVTIRLVEFVNVENSPPYSTTSVKGDLRP